MQTIFIQVKCAMGASYEAASRIIEVEKVSEVYSTSGNYDLMVKCHLDDGTDPGQFVNKSIQTIDGVIDTFTIITFNAFS